VSNFVARYPGECADCGERFEQGTWVRYEDDDIVHVDCARKGRRPGDPWPLPAERYGPRVCPTCYLTSCDCQRDVS